MATTSFSRLVDIVKSYLKKNEPKGKIISIPYFPVDIYKKNYSILNDELLRDLRESRLEIPSLGSIAGGALHEISLTNSAIDTRSLRERYLEILQNRPINQSIMDDLREARRRFNNQPGELNMPKRGTAQLVTQGEPTHNRIPETLVEALRWAPSYHYRKMAILHNARMGTEHAIICGKLLDDAHRSKDWKHDGSSAVSFYQWVEKELGFKRTNAHRMMSCWKAVKKLLPEHLELILQIDFSKLSLIAPYLKDSDNQEELLHMAKENPVRAIEYNLMEIDGKTAPDNCNHADGFERYKKCKCCGKFFKEE